MPQARSEGADLPIDPRVTIPPAVVATGSRADELQRQFIAQMSGEQPQPEQPQPEQPQPEQPQPEQPQPEQPQPEQPQRTVSSDDDPNNETWKQRFLSAQGRLRAQDEALKVMRTRMGNLEETIATMQVPPAAPVTPEPTPRYITPEDVETYGDDFLDTVRRTAQEVVEPLRRQYEKRVEQIDTRVQNVQQVIGTNARERLLSHMDTSVPNWRAINEDPDFISWLDDIDPLTGRQRQGMLTSAWEMNDAARSAAFFTTFLREKGIVTQPGNSPEDTGRKAPVVSLGQFAAPGRAKSGDAPARPREQPAITRTFITKFYTDVANGKYANRDAERAQIEADIFSAQQGGRIT